MIERDEVHNASMKGPRPDKFKRRYCNYYRQHKRHAFADDRASGFSQCVDCGIIDHRTVNNHGIYNRNVSK